MSHIWQCPACQAELVSQDKVLRCEHNHTYDVAKEGYVNLLLANQKRSKDPGDNKAMINARRGFLEQGYYQPLADKLAELISIHLPLCNLNRTLALFDAGCGEGYYLNQIRQTLQQRHLPATSDTPRLIQAAGCDIAKVAIQKASKKYQQCHFAVASTFHLPVSNASQDAVIQVFAPASATEVQRVLRANGIWLQVNPAPEHLRELKAMIYDSAEPHQTKAISSTDLQLVGDHRLSFEITFGSNADKTNLLMMTPFYWSASEEAKQRIAQSLYTVTCDFHIQMLKKRVRT